MLMLNGSNLKKMFSDEVIFENVSLKVESTDKIGFIGVNGAGKSTLFNMLAGRLENDGGEIARAKETRIGYLEQHALSDGDRTIMEELLTVFAEVIDIEKQLEDVSLAMERPDSGNNIHALVARQTALQERYADLDGAFYRSRIKSALNGLGFSDSEFATPIGKLSGGQKTRIALCKILLSDANLLLLDEPTNHLDMDSVEWLEDFLLHYSGAFIVISHDRYFLDKVTDKTFELENGHFRAFDGNYTAYMAQREIERLTEQRHYDDTTREIHRLEEVIEQQRRWKHKKNKKTHTLDNTRKMIERLEKDLVEPEKAPESMRFRFKAAAGGAQRVFEAAGLGMQFGQNRLFGNVDMLIKKGEKVFLLGPNGCGKTTLLKLLMGMYTPSCGTCKVGENIAVGYYDQLKENLHREKTVINEIWDEYPGLTQTEVRSALAVFLFKGEDVFKEIRSLSGGELARVELTKLLLQPVNFLVMDEPTNHLDIAAREALETALSDYDGTMLMVSHDRYFVNRLADRILYLTPDGIIEYDGDYDDFLASREAAAPAPAKETKVTGKALEYQERKRLEAEKRKIHNRSAKIEALIDETESRIRQLTAMSEEPAIATDYIRLGELTDQIGALHQTLDGYMEEWEALQLLIEEKACGGR